VTGAQIAAVRRRVVALARKYEWIEG
jgi:hypothetical protein